MTIYFYNAIISEHKSRNQKSCVSLTILGLIIVCVSD